MESKYFAYYITDYKPVLMNDIRSHFFRHYNEDEAKKIIAQVEANIHTNDWEHVINDNLNDNLKSLVLVKISNVKEMFTVPNIDNNDQFIHLLTSNIGFGYKYNKGDISGYKLRNTTFTGTQSTGYIMDATMNYIFIEQMIIPLKNILNFYQDRIQFDSIGQPSVFIDSINQIKTSCPHFDDKIGTQVLHILNAIIKNIPYGPDNKVHWTSLKAFIPLLDSSYYKNVGILWKELIGKRNKNYNPLSFLSNYNMIINNKTYFDLKDVLHNNLYSICCNMNAKVYITSKKWENISYQDAMPYKSFFICNENVNTNNDAKHNMIANRIESLEHNISMLRKQLALPNSSEENKFNINNKIKHIKDEINKLVANLTPINPNYKSHILHQTEIGIRTTFNDYLNSYKVIVFMCSILSNAAEIKDKFRFKYEIPYNRNDDIFKLFISKETLDNILSLNIKVDLFSLSRLFKFTMTNKFDDDNYNINAYRYNNKCEVEDTPESVICLKNFLKDNLAVDLIRHQTSNLLWMIKLEDEIDDSKLVIDSLKPQFLNITESIEDIKPFICSFKNKIPESFIKNYMIDYKGQKLLVELKEHTVLAKSISIINELNADNIRHYGSNLRNHYCYDADIIKKISSYDDYVRDNAVQVPLCGGAICDEVGLGKTLSVISSMIVKMKHDMLKYAHYKSALFDLICTLDENPSQDYNDPLETGFEYNNLIIVPSRLTSQWENEIEKYCKDKFNLRVKVIVGIQSIKNLEKELHNFYDQLSRGEISNAEEFRNGGKKASKKKTPLTANEKKAQEKLQKEKEKFSKATSADYPYGVSQEPIIKTEKFNELDIAIHGNYK